MDTLKSKIREVPDFPRPGILFYDVTTLLKDREGLQHAIDALADPFQGKEIDKVLGIESRGFIFGPALAYRLGAGFIPVRKRGKLPAATLQMSYDLEYGTDTLEIHRDAIQPGERVLVVDDLIATGGTARAALQMVEQLEGELVGLAFLIELEFLHGREKLDSYPIFSVLRY